MRRFDLVALGVASIVAARAARANGAFPDEFSIHFPPGAPHRILLGANFGLLVSEDDGRTWRYSCEPWVVAGSNAALASANVLFYQVAADGTLLASAVDLNHSTDVACTWPPATGAIAGQVISDFFPDPNDATVVLAEIASSNGSYIIASRDGAKTFDPAHLYDTTDILTGIEIARSAAGVVYATSTPKSAPGTAKFLVSTSAGAPGSWTATDLTAALQLPAGTQPRILAVDPLDAKKVYLRLLMGLTDAMAVTSDGGKTFQTLLTINGQFSSFVIGGDGTVYAGTLDGKLYVRPASAVDPTAFVSRNAPHLRCLGQRPGTTRLYACADMIVDGYSIGTSDDGGATFQPLMSFRDLLGPLTCPPVQTNCQPHWERIQAVLGIAGTLDGGAGADAGAPPARTGGSHCATGGVAGWGLWIVLAFARQARRRRRA